jgi:hypothetical protein
MTHPKLVELLSLTADRPIHHAYARALVEWIDAGTPDDDEPYHFPEGLTAPARDAIWAEVARYGLGIPMHGIPTYDSYRRRARAKASKARTGGDGLDGLRDLLDL